MYRYSSLRNGLIGAWCPSLGDNGRIVRDSSGQGNNATLNAGVSNVARQGGTAISFDGTSGIATLGKASFVGLTAITVSYWFRRTTTTTLVGVQQGAAELSRMFFAGGEDNRIYIGGRFVTGGGDLFSSASLASLSLNTWHHFTGALIVGTARDTGHQIWLNGVQQTLTHSFTGNTVASIPAFTSFADIGERFTGSGTGFRSGEMDDIRIYNRSLTQAEILMLGTQRGIGLLLTRHRRASVLGSRFSVNVAGTWRDAVPWVNVAGVWKQATPSIRNAGIWR